MSSLLDLNLQRPSPQSPAQAVSPDRHPVFFVPYIDPAITALTLQSATTLVAGLNATIVLLAVQVLPFPAPFHLPDAVHHHLETELSRLVELAPCQAAARIVLARDEHEGYRYVLEPGATVLIGTYRHWWRRRERKLARNLTRAGYKVALMTLEASHA